MTIDSLDLTLQHSFQHLLKVSLCEIQTIFLETITHTLFVYYFHCHVPLINMKTLGEKKSAGK